MYFVYVLRNSKGFLYKGISDNVERRIIQHNNGESKGTRGKGPWNLIYFEQCQNRKEARMREKYLKSGIGREFLQSYIENAVVK